MTTLTAGRSTGLPTFLPPNADSPGDLDGGVAARGPHSLARRLLERFALIAFGLYHVPLFLNNYPSLGGGGAKSEGLAISWGHVFTPVGVWVARHVFHMTGPMPMASRGDNADIGEEFGRLLVSVVIAVVGAVWWTAADRKRPRGRWVEGTLRVLLRYSIALGLVSYALGKIFPVQFPPLTAIALEGRLGELNPQSLLWGFMQYSQPYSSFGGLMELVAIVLLCFRRTATLGALVCLAVMTNVAFLNYAYGVPIKLYSTMIAASAGVLVLYDVRRLLALFVRNQAVAPAPLASTVLDRLPQLLRWTIKVALVGSVVASTAVAIKSIIGRERTTSPRLDGGWVVTSFARDGQSLDSTVTPARWRRFMVDRSGVAIRLESDSLLRCLPAASPDLGIMTFTCSGNRKGELKWTRTGNTLRLDGAFDGARVTASGRLLNRSDYRLLRSGFRLIYDR